MNQHTNTKAKREQTVRDAVNRWDFAHHIEAAGVASFRAAHIHTLQINVGKLCNQACHHCHVEAGPKRTEQMTAATAEKLIRLIQASDDLDVVDITGGAPELNPQFWPLVEAARAAGCHVIDRCNLTVLFEPGQANTAARLAENHVEIVASLPCYSIDNVDKQRGVGVFDKSIRALRLLNALGYGLPDSSLKLNLVYNPGGAFLPPDQAGLEQAYKDKLMEAFGIEFHQLYTITNMPIKRFAEQLLREGKVHEYMEVLVQNFNPSTVDGLMCRYQVSVGWDGQLYDCDFNQMLELGVLEDQHASIFDLDSLKDLYHRPIATEGHCFGCTAGSGSSCGGALD